MARDLQKEIRITDKRTGEVLSNAVVTISKEGLLVPFKKRYRHEKFFTCPELSKPIYIGYFMLLAQQVEMHSNVVMSRKNKHVMPITKQGILNLLGISERTYQSFMRDVRSVGAIAVARFQSKNTCYIINPAYVYNGIGINPTLFRIFQHDKEFINCLCLDDVRALSALLEEDILMAIEDIHPDIYELKFNKKN